MVALPHQLSNWYTGVSRAHDHRPNCCVLSAKEHMQPFGMRTSHTCIAPALCWQLQVTHWVAASVTCDCSRAMAPWPGGTHRAGAVQSQESPCSAGPGGNGTQRSGLPARQCRRKGALHRVSTKAWLRQLYLITAGKHVQGSPCTAAVCTTVCMTGGLRRYPLPCLVHEAWRMAHRRSRRSYSPIASCASRAGCRSTRRSSTTTRASASRSSATPRQATGRRYVRARLRVRSCCVSAS